MMCGHNADNTKIISSKYCTLWQSKLMLPSLQNFTTTTILHQVTHNTGPL